jgi:Transcriptional regulators
MTIINQLKAQNNFNGSEKDLAEYILKNKEAVLNLSIQKLATNTFSSTSTVVRLCRKIGLKGFKDFKIKLSAELQKHYDDISTIDPDFPFTEDDSNKEIAQKIANVMETSIKQTSELLDNSTLEKAIRLILKAKNLGIFAYGDTYISALSFQNKLMKINFHAQLPTLVEESNFLAANFQKEDCAIVISYSGQTKSTYK